MASQPEIDTAMAIAAESYPPRRPNASRRLPEGFAPVAPFCPHFGTCGGCLTQHVPAEVYAAWKRDTVVAALAQAGVKAEVAPLVDAHGAGRRRATFHARVLPDGIVETGFMRARAHDIVAIDVCPLFAPELGEAPAVAKALAEAIKGHGKPLDIQITATLAGLDVDLRGAGPLPAPLTAKLTALAATLDLARLSLHGASLIERRAPQIAFGAFRVVPPPGGFLQATEAGEDALAERAAQALKGASRVADLFCGAGAFALRLAADHSVYAADNDAAAITALRRAGAGSVESATRDLFRSPLPALELARFDAVLFDPPRAGAETQAHEIAKSHVARVVAISCNAETFSRDARILQDGGYACEGVTPIDQFRHSAHVELFASFRYTAKPRRKGVLS